jgi:hypothetical protein
MTTDTLDQAPADTGTDTTGTATTTQAPAAPAPDAAQTADADTALDLLDLDGDDGEGDDGADAEDADATEQPSIRAIGPPVGATEDEAATWREQHGIPEAPDGYTPPQIEGVAWDEEGLGAVLKAVHPHNVANPAVADALNAYGKWAQAKRAQIEQRDIANVKAVMAALGDDGVAAARSAAKAMPAELRTLLNEARGPDGTRIINSPAVLQLIAAAYGPNGGRTSMTADLKTELAEIDAAMNQDVGSLYRPWKTSGMSASERKLQIQRELDAAAETQARHTAYRDAGSDEERQLLALHQNDPAFFEFGRWKDSNISPAQRLYELRNGKR